MDPVHILIAQYMDKVGLRGLLQTESNMPIKGLFEATTTLHDEIHASV